MGYFLYRPFSAILKPRFTETITSGRENASTRRRPTSYLKSLLTISPAPSRIRTHAIVRDIEQQVARKLGCLDRSSKKALSYDANNVFSIHETLKDYLADLPGTVPHGTEHLYSDQTEQLYMNDFSYTGRTAERSYIVQAFHSHSNC